MIHFHPLNVADTEHPKLFNNPFDYEPHPLVMPAVAEVQAYIKTHPSLQADAEQGKMLGVLVVEHADGRLGFLAAYSGLLAGRNDWPFFVPPVFDAQQPDGHFKQTEARISAMNAEVEQLSEAPERQAELKRERKRLSEELQLWLFRQYRMRNARGETKDLVELWHDYHQSTNIRKKYPLPPGGSGDCCAPKLLQYAYEHGLRPVTMAEFWYGASPRGEIRHHGHYYPACRGKCLPILTFMLQGLEVGQGPERQNVANRLNVVYEDAAVLVVVKPSGLLSVPGRTDAPSVECVLRQRYERILMPHRLDMDTSGLMVVARTDEAYKHLQHQFYARNIYKRYIALLDGMVRLPQGTVTLPLRPDPLDRPRQVVDCIHGKQAITDYEVLSRQDGRTLIALTPHTGRTHQLRVHCAHHEGLGVPIVGDNLYGVPSQRLCLHAERLSFDHPVTGQRMAFEAPADF